ncbi:glycosyltransferase [Acidovorax sp. LjRoot66]|uniref:CgeB family protein n=1 Tax=Acidovorax sp. LjRoot66 TaxID=3342334 RepID=UPI003ED17448
MSEFLVLRAHQAFRNKDYAQALQLYRQAGDFLGSNLFEANLRLCQTRFHSVQADKAAQEFRQSEFSDTDKRIKYADRFRVALIADEFTTNSFADEFVTIPIEPSDWRTCFEEFQPEIFFCESAWSGADIKRRPWKGKIYASKNFSKENRTVLLEILMHCRKNGIPTVFWNKEDPTHFTDRVHDFVKTAKEFDFVFTTAAECVDGYQRDNGVSRAFALPFATNPRLFNPVESGLRSSRVVFAGSWYANHVQRSMDMEHILDAIRADGYQLDIYDRYHGDPDPLHIWPERYHPFLHPSQPHECMPSVYKSSRFGVNFNTVTDSPTMFARRVFELMSSNTLVLSNYSRGTEEMFGDLIVYPDKQPDRLRSLSDADIDALRDRALHKVLGEHTYRHRWLQVLRNIGIPHAAREFTITATCLVNQLADAMGAIAWFQQYGQNQPGAHLLLVASAHMPDLEVAELYRQFNRHGISVTSSSHASRYAMLDRYQPVETSHFLAFNPSNPPPADWLARAGLHLQYATAQPLTPASEATRRYSTGLAETDAPLLDLRGRFGQWLQQPERHRDAYFV